MKPPCTREEDEGVYGQCGGQWTVWTPPEVSMVDTAVVTGGRRGAAGGTNDY